MHCGQRLAFRTLLLCALLAPIAALADWQWTRWGMKVDEVIAASNASVAPFERAEQPNSRSLLLAKGKYSALDVEFDANFYFDRNDKGLVLVELMAREATFSKCLKLKSALGDVYGKPDETGRVAIIRLQTSMWRDTEKRNRVLLAVTESPDSCSLQYSPLVDRAKSGV